MEKYVLLENGKVICMPTDYQAVFEAMSQIIDELSVQNDASIYHCYRQGKYLSDDVTLVIKFESGYVFINYKIEGSTLKEQ